MKNKHILLSFLALSAIALDSTAAPQLSPVPSPAEPVNLSNITSGDSNGWSGIGRIRGENKSLCTATLIDTRSLGSPTHNDSAYVITSNRCLTTDLEGIYNYIGGTRHNIPSDGYVYFNNFEDAPSRIKKYTFKHIAWQSDESLNLAIIELTAPLSTLLSDGIHPLKLADYSPPTGTEILMFGVPEFSSLHSVSCQQQALVNIATYPWVSTNVLANQCATLTPGALGGPVLNKKTNELISVLIASTHATTPDKKCLTGSPCELENNLTLWKPDTHYTRPVSFLNQCFVQGKLDAVRPECGLYKLTSIVLNDGQLPPAKILEKLNTENRWQPETFKLNLTSDAPYLRYKYTHDATECRSGHEYSPIIEGNLATIDFTLDNTTGMHALCILGVESHEDSLTNAQYDGAKVIAIERIKANPAQTPQMTVIPHKAAGGFYAVNWDYSSPLLNRYEVKYGPAESTDCATPEGYNEIPGFEKRVRDDAPWEQLYEHKDHPDNPDWILIKKSRQQLSSEHFSRRFFPEHHAITLCTVLFNQENQRSEPRVDILRPR